jgi:hypothetical protein
MDEGIKSTSFDRGAQPRGDDLSRRPMRSPSLHRHEILRQDESSKKTKENTHSMLIRSFPCATCLITASSPSVSALFLLEKISRDVLYIASTALAIVRVACMGIRSHRKRRNSGGPRCTRNGMIYRGMASAEALVLRSVRWDFGHMR